MEEGGRQLIQAVRHHDHNWEAYRTEQRRLIGAYLATNPEVVQAYDALFDQLFASSVAQS